MSVIIKEKINYIINKKIQIIYRFNIYVLNKFIKLWWNEIL